MNRKNWPTSSAWWIVAILLAIILSGPFIIMLAASFEESRAYFTSAWEWLPRHPTLTNYEIIFTRSSVLRWTLNSLIISTIPVAASVLISLVLGYVFARKEFPGKEPVYWLFISSIMIPFQVTLAPLNLMMKAIGWIDTYWVLTVPQLLSVTGIFFMRQFMQTIPATLEEAAEMDGCNPWQIIQHVVIPLSKTVIATLAILGFIGAWNSFLFPLIFTASERMQPLTVGLATLSDVSSSFGLNMAAASINFLPTFLIFLVFQRHFVKGIALGGMKL
jgi:multiple sugar transport system permease protein